MEAGRNVGRRGPVMSHWLQVYFVAKANRSC